MTLLEQEEGISQSAAAYHSHPTDTSGYGNFHSRVVRHDMISDGETRSELLIRDTSDDDNGTYHCQAENKAARGVSNFTLHVLSNVEEPKILHLRLEYFVAVAIGVITILLLITIAVAAMLIRLCRKRIKKQKQEVLQQQQQQQHLGLKSSNGDVNHQVDTASSTITRQDKVIKGSLLLLLLHPFFQ